MARGSRRGLVVVVIDDDDEEENLLEKMCRQYHELVSKRKRNTNTWLFGRSRTAPTACCAVIPRVLRRMCGGTCCCACTWAESDPGPGLVDGCCSWLRGRGAVDGAGGATFFALLVELGLKSARPPCFWTVSHPSTLAVRLNAMCFFLSYSCSFDPMASLVMRLELSFLPSAITGSSVSPPIIRPAPSSPSSRLFMPIPMPSSPNGLSPKGLSSKGDSSAAEPFFSPEASSGGFAADAPAPMLLLNDVWPYSSVFSKNILKNSTRHCIHTRVVPLNIHWATKWPISRNCTVPKKELMKFRPEPPAPASRSPCGSPRST
jgi:hypothetical protein